MIAREYSVVGKHLLVFLFWPCLLRPRLSQSQDVHASPAAAQLQSPPVCCLPTQPDSTPLTLARCPCSLNHFMKRSRLPLPVRRQLREFLRYRRTHRGLQDYPQLMQVLSPALRAQVAASLQTKWVLLVSLCACEGPCEASGEPLWSWGAFWRAPMLVRGLLVSPCACEGPPGEPLCLWGAFW